MLSKENDAYKEPELDKMISVIMPALNEQANIRKAVLSVCSAFDRLNLTGEVIVIDDGSSDNTGSIVQRLSKDDTRVRIFSHPRPCGIGASFWDGAERSHAESVCLMPGDNEIDPFEVLRYAHLISDVDIIVPFFYNSRIRPAARIIISDIFRLIINMTFGTSFNYTNGAVIYRRKVLLSLTGRESGFFYQTDILVRLMRRGYLFAEVPSKLLPREGGDSKAISFKSLRAVAAGYFKLVKDIYLRREKREIIPDSMAFKRSSLS